jgi:outer membrane protein TolC
MSIYLHGRRLSFSAEPKAARIKRKMPFTIIGTLISTLLLVSPTTQSAQSHSTPIQLTQGNTTSRHLSLQDAISLAHANDEWLVRSDLLEARLLDLSEAATALPDPTISMSLLNLPTDGFAVDQEPMTQLKLGASQMFPRGDTLALKKQRYRVSAGEQPYQRADRQRKITLYTTQLWLDTYKSAASYRLVNEAKPLFDKLTDIVAASYASSDGSARQQDIIRAELELLRLNDRLVALDTQRQVTTAKLSRYLFSTNQPEQSAKRSSSFANIKLPLTLPTIDDGFTLLLDNTNADTHALYLLTEAHPMLNAFEQRVKASSVDIDIAKQSLSPQFGVNASYALRDDAPELSGGNSRANFFSVGLSVSLPLFSSNQRNADIAGSIKMVEAMRTEKRLLMRELIAGLLSAYEDFKGSNKRYDIYNQQIVPQMSQQADASLNAYTNDTGDFAEVVRAKIAQLDAKVAQLEIDVNRRKALAQINYFIALDSSNNDYRGTQGPLNTNAQRNSGVSPNE